MVVKLSGGIVASIVIEREIQESRDTTKRQHLKTRKEDQLHTKIGGCNPNFGKDDGRGMNDKNTQGLTMK